jgi:hypothetical protein
VDVMPSMSTESGGAREAYATVLYGGESGDPPLACAAAVLGRTLRQHDPNRDRVAIVRSLSERAKAILTDGGLWTLHEPSVKTLPMRNRLRVMKRKNLLWSLTMYSRVLFLDADIFLLPDPPDEAGRRHSRLQSLWRLDAELGATGVNPHHHPNMTLAGTCFNGGMLLLRPAEDTFNRLEALDPEFAQRHAEPGTGRRCPGLDQPLLNRAFPTWTHLSDAVWRALPHWLASPRSPSTCSLHQRRELSTQFDVYHFFHKALPWENEWCAVCVRGGLRCRPVMPLGSECAVQALAQRLWWEELLWKLPPNSSAACIHVCEQRLDRGAERARLRGGLCTGCARKPEPACVGPAAGSPRRTLDARR